MEKPFFQRPQVQGQALGTVIVPQAVQRLFPTGAEPNLHSLKWNAPVKILQQDLFLEIFPCIFQSALL